MAAAAKIGANLASAMTQKDALTRELLAKLDTFFSSSENLLARRAYGEITYPKSLVKILLNEYLSTYLRSLILYDASSRPRDRAHATLSAIQDLRTGNRLLLEIKELFLQLVSLENLLEKLTSAIRVPAAARREAVGGAGGPPAPEEENEEVWEVNTNNLYSGANIARLAELERLEKIKQRGNVNPRLRNANYEAAMKAVRNEEHRAMTMFSKKTRHRRSVRGTRRRR